MPVSVKIDPFSKQPIRADLPLRTPQARILSALMPSCQSDPESEWPLVTRAQLGVRAGYTAISGTVTRALNGIRAESSSRNAHPGLLDRGLVMEDILNIEGVSEVNYRATAKGVRAYQSYIGGRGALPDLKPAAVCINDRYRIQPP